MGNANVSKFVKWLVLSALISILVFSSNFSSNPSQHMSTKNTTFAGLSTATLANEITGASNQTSTLSSSITVFSSNSPSRLLNLNLPHQCVGAFNESSFAGSACSIQNFLNLSNLKIAIVQPVFTSTAYSSFYTFYAHYPHLSQNETVTQNIGLLNASVNYDWGMSSSVYTFFTSKLVESVGIIQNKNLFVLDDIQVTNGALFNSSTHERNYDVVILGFTEYVTQQEYSSLKQFVHEGGRLIILSGCSFLAKVTYDANTKRVILDEGHGYYFNGTAVRSGAYNYFERDNTNWVGSNYGPLFYTHGYKFKDAVANTSNALSVFVRSAAGNSYFCTSYPPHEENVVTNGTDSIIAYWQMRPMNSTVSSYIGGKVVATYEHDYGKGIVIHMGIFGTDLLGNDPQFELLVLAAIGMPSN